MPLNLYNIKIKRSSFKPKGALPLWGQRLFSNSLSYYQNSPNARKKWGHPVHATAVSLNYAPVTPSEYFGDSIPDEENSFGDSYSFLVDAWQKCKKPKTIIYLPKNASGFWIRGLISGLAAQGARVLSAFSVPLFTISEEISKENTLTNLRDSLWDVLVLRKEDRLNVAWGFCTHHFYFGVAYDLRNIQNILKPYAHRKAFPGLLRKYKRHNHIVFFHPNIKGWALRGFSGRHYRAIFRFVFFLETYNLSSQDFYEKSEMRLNILQEELYERGSLRNPPVSLSYLYNSFDDSFEFLDSLLSNISFPIRIEGLQGLTHWRDYYSLFLEFVENNLEYPITFFNEDLIKNFLPLKTSEILTQIKKRGGIINLSEDSLYKAADLFYQDHLRLPKSRDGDASDYFGHCEDWGNVNTALRSGGRGFGKVSSLYKALVHSAFEPSTMRSDETLFIQTYDSIFKERSLSEEDIFIALKMFLKEEGSLPSETSDLKVGSFLGLEITWKQLNTLLQKGVGIFPKNSSLNSIMAKYGLIGNLRVKKVKRKNSLKKLVEKKIQK